MFLCHQTVSSSETVNATVQKLLRTVNEQVNENFTSETSVLWVLLGEMAYLTPFKVLTPDLLYGCQRQI